MHFTSDWCRLEYKPVIAFHDKSKVNLYLKKTIVSSTHRASGALKYLTKGEDKKKLTPNRTGEENKNPAVGKKS